MYTKLSTSKKVFLIALGIGFSVSTYADTRPTLQSLQQQINSLQNNQVLGTYLTNSKITPDRPNGKPGWNNNTVNTVTSPVCDGGDVAIGISYTVEPTNSCLIITESKPNDNRNGDQWNMTFYKFAEVEYNNTVCDKTASTYITYSTLCLDFLPLH